MWPLQQALQLWLGPSFADPGNSKSWHLPKVQFPGATGRGDDLDYSEQDAAPQALGEIRYRYDPDAEILDLCYADGVTERFLMVPQFIQRALEAAEDRAAFVELHIKNGPFARARLSGE